MFAYIHIYMHLCTHANIHICTYMRMCIFHMTARFHMTPLGGHVESPGVGSYAPRSSPAQKIGDRRLVVARD